MEPLILVVVAGSLTVVKSVLRCIEILARARADNMREQARRATVLAIMEAVQAGSTGTASRGRPR